MPKQIIISPCYNSGSLIIRKGMSLKEIYYVLQRLEGREIDRVYLAKIEPPTADNDNLDYYR